MKEPQDRKPKKPSVKEVDGGKQVTFHDIKSRDRSGKPIGDEALQVTVAYESLDDFELLDDLRAIDVDRNASRLPSLLRRLVGDDFQSVMDALRDPGTGRVRIERANQWLADLMAVLNPNS